MFSCFMIGPHCVLGKAMTGRLQKVGSHLEITLGGSDVDVAKVGRELREQPLNVLAGAIPCDQPMHGSRVTTIPGPE